MTASQSLAPAQLFKQLYQALAVQLSLWHRHPEFTVAQGHQMDVACIRVLLRPLLGCEGSTHTRGGKLSTYGNALLHACNFSGTTRSTTRRLERCIGLASDSPCSP